MLRKSNDDRRFEFRLSWRKLDGHQSLPAPRCLRQPGATFPKSWWPVCAKCQKVVDKLEPAPISWLDHNQPCVRHYFVTCHGETELSFVGIWAADEINRSNGRLPNAFADAIDSRRDAVSLQLHQLISLNSIGSFDL